MESSSPHEHTHLKMLPALPHTEHPASLSTFRYMDTPRHREGCTSSQGHADIALRSTGRQISMCLRNPMQADMLGHSEAEPVQNRQVHTRRSAAHTRGTCQQACSYTQISPECAQKGTGRRHRDTHRQS